jgi:tight adherence protein B
MTAALLSAALAVLVWPDGSTKRRQRVAGVVRGVAGADGSLVRWRVPVPAAAVGGAVAVAAAVSTPLVAALAGVVAAAACRTWVLGRRAGRADERLAEVAEGLGALAAELRSGRSLDAAADTAAAACGDEASGRALARAVGGQGVASADGQPDAAAAALDRISAAVRLSVRTGCSLAVVLAAVEDDLRARRRADQELRTATAAPRAAAALLAGLPVFGLLMGSGVGADPWQVLTTTGTGQVLLVAGVGLELAGLAWSRGLVRRALR